MEAVSDIIKFQPNIPVRLTMKFDGTKPCKSKYNDEDQFMLTTTDGRIAFLTPYANSKLEAAGIKRGDEITITQTVLLKGQRKTIDWVIGKTAGGETDKGSAATGATVAAPVAQEIATQATSHALANASVPSRSSTQIEDALKTAIAAAKAAEQFGQEIGYLIKFDKDDVRSIAITLLIGKQQRGDR